MLRSILLKLSDSKGFANWVTSNGTTRRMARRFVAGETLDEAIAAAREGNNAGMHVSLDYLGENVATISEAQHSRDAHLHIFQPPPPPILPPHLSAHLAPHRPHP